jgi:hypothetical protein
MDDLIEESRTDFGVHVSAHRLYVVEFQHRNALFLARIAPYATDFQTDHSSVLELRDSF